MCMYIFQVFQALSVNKIYKNGRFTRPKQFTYLHTYFLLQYFKKVRTTSSTGKKKTETTYLMMSDY